MDEIETPDEDGGIEPGTNVSFIVIAAKKGIQAAAVTIADPPVEEKETEKENDKENIPELENSFADTGFGGDDDGFGNAEEEDHAAVAPTPAPAAAADDAAWGF